VHVVITDFNDNTPQFLRQLTNGRAISINPNFPPNRLIIRIQARDADSADNGRVGYKLVNEDFLPFVINFTSGDVRFLPPAPLQ
jgi:hypothetical protein